MNSIAPREIKLNEVRYRLTREEEIGEAVEVFFTSLSDLSERLNITAPLPPREYVLVMYAYIFRTGIFHVAEMDGRLVAVCHAIVRDHLWFLSGFWALPGFQGLKIGGTLLRRVWEEGERMGAKVFFTWSSTDLQAMASYMKMGMLPGYQTLTFSGTAENLFDKRTGYEVSPLALSTAAEMDAQIRETRREIDHQFWLDEFQLQGRQVMRDGRAIGYYYFGHGTIGPAAWFTEADGEALLEFACLEASRQTEQIRLAVPGLNHTAIRFALRSNLRLTHYAHHLTTASFGRMEQYLPSGPSLF